MWAVSVNRTIRVSVDQPRLAGIVALLVVVDAAGGATVLVVVAGPVAVAATLGSGVVVCVRCVPIADAGVARGAMSGGGVVERCGCEVGVQPCSVANNAHNVSR